MFYDPPHAMTDHHFDILFAGVMPIPESIGKWKAYQNSKDQSGLITISEELVAHVTTRLTSLRNFGTRDFPRPMILSPQASPVLSKGRQ